MYVWDFTCIVQNNFVLTRTLFVSKFVYLLLIFLQNNSRSNSILDCTSPPITTYTLNKFDQKTYKIKKNKDNFILAYKPSFEAFYYGVYLLTYKETYLFDYHYQKYNLKLSTVFCLSFHYFQARNIQMNAS